MVGIHLWLVLLEPSYATSRWIWSRKVKSETLVWNIGGDKMDKKRW